MRASKKKVRRRRNTYLGMGMVAAVAVIFLGALMIQSRDLRSRLAINQARIAQLQEDIESEKDRTKEIEELKEYMQTDEFAEEVARDRLGLVKDNEIVFREENGS